MTVTSIKLTLSFSNHEECYLHELYIIHKQFV